MKKQLALKYPHSANLFRFCRRVLDYKLGGARVIDQDVGQLLGFDPADCSHWKKGKKNIHSIYAMRNISSQLGVDESLIIDLASGDIDDEEAYCEYLGYGDIELDHKTLELAKRDFFKHNSFWSKDQEQEFRKLFFINHSKIQNIVSEIHKKINFLEAPLYLPELVSYYSEIKFQNLPEVEDTKGPLVQSKKDGKKFLVSYKIGSETKPFVRFLIAKELAKHFLPPIKEFSPELQSYYEKILEVESNIFAGHLLVPSALLRREIQKLNPAENTLAQLTNTFWVSKSFMKLRLKEILSI